MNKLILPSLSETADIWQQTLNWQPTAEQQLLFQQLYELILQGNQKLNLTTITKPDEFWEKHLWDSLRGMGNGEWGVRSTEALAAIDIGTGGGFPGIPVALTMANCTVTLLDSTRKKMVFLEEVVTALGLTNVKTITGRAEEIGQQTQYREKYDIAMIRAVATASVCAEYALPLLKVGGLAVVYRGTWTPEETNHLSMALEQLGGEVQSIDEFVTPLSKSVRNCLYLRKVAATPEKFPRGVGIPTQKPL